MTHVVTCRYAIMRYYPPSPEAEPGLWPHLEEVYHHTGTHGPNGQTTVGMKDVRNGQRYVYHFDNDAPGAYVWQLPTFEERARHYEQRRQLQLIEQKHERSLPFYRRRDWLAASWRARWRWLRSRLPRLISSGDLDDIPF